MTRSEAEAIVAALVKLRESATDEQALSVPVLYPAWRSETEYHAGDRVLHGGVLYKVLQAHTSQADWTPDITPALFVVVSLDEWPEFVQPTGAHDAYKKGDKVTFEGKHYISLIDGNVYSPTAYPAGWQEQA